MRLSSMFFQLHPIQCRQSLYHLLLFFFFNDPPASEIYTLSLHDALPIFARASSTVGGKNARPPLASAMRTSEDRKSTRLNSSHSQISYDVFSLKKKKLETGKIAKQANGSIVAREG